MPNKQLTDGLLFYGAMVYVRLSQILTKFGTQLQYAENIQQEKSLLYTSNEDGELVFFGFNCEV